uniref:Uncharacterized protein n=1 Tax=Zea mays TaxID=4577 RepID=B6SMA7_MAIZE|nr:hypothetical protein [Zea mays]|eukprot:NP_001142697.1 uncharacterized protein LOC100275001 [Zea mays]
MNASWLQRLVTSTLRGYPNNAHLKELEKAPENLYLFKADEPDHDTLTAAVEGCEGIFHLATPAVPEDKIVDPEEDLMADVMNKNDRLVRHRRP